MHPLSCEFNICKCFICKIFSLIIKNEINTDPSLVLLGLFTSYFHEPQISPQRVPRMFVVLLVNRFNLIKSEVFPFVPEDSLLLLLLFLLLFSGTHIQRVKGTEISVWITTGHVSYAKRARK